MRLQCALAMTAGFGGGFGQVSVWNRRHEPPKTAAKLLSYYFTGQSRARVSRALLPKHPHPNFNLKNLPCTTRQRRQKKHEYSLLSRLSNKVNLIVLDAQLRRTMSPNRRYATDAPDGSHEQKCDLASRNLQR